MKIEKDIVKEYVKLCDILDRAIEQREVRKALKLYEKLNAFLDKLSDEEIEFLESYRVIRAIPCEYFYEEG